MHHGVGNLVVILRLCPLSKVSRNLFILNNSDICCDQNLVVMHLRILDLFKRAVL